MITAMLAAFLVQGGPPLLTDNPATPGDGRFEINLAFKVEKFRHETLYKAPIIDFNYGIGERAQLKAELPWLFVHEHPGPDESGLCNALLGLKYRSLDQEQDGIDLSMYPQVEFRTNPHARRAGLVGDELAFLFPAEAEKVIGPVSVNIEFGYLVVHGDEDFWVWGIAVGRDLLDGVELLGEIHGTTGVRFDHAELVWNLGLRVKLSVLNNLLVSAGRGIRGEGRSEPQFIGYLGLQFNF